MKPGEYLRIVNPKKPGEFLILHESDFVPGVHELWVEPGPAAAAGEPAPIPDAVPAPAGEAPATEAPGTPPGNDLAAYDPPAKRSHRRK